MGRPSQPELPSIVRQIPRAEPPPTLEADEPPPQGPPEQFFWTRPAEPERGERFARYPPSSLTHFALSRARRLRWYVWLSPAAAVLSLVGLVRWRAYETFVDVEGSGTSAGSKYSVVTLALVPVAALGAYWFSTAVALLVAQHARDGSMQVGAAARLAIRRLPRIMTVNLLYGLLVTAAFIGPQLLLVRYTYDHDLTELWPWLYLGAGIVAYCAPQINVFFTAIKLENRRPKFRHARQLVRGQRAATWGRVLLWQLVYVALTAAWQIPELGAWSVAAVLLGTVSTVVGIAILTTVFTLLYVDLAGVTAEVDTSTNGTEASDGVRGEQQP